MPPKNMLLYCFDNNLNKTRKSNCTNCVQSNKLSTKYVHTIGERISRVYSRILNKAIITVKEVYFDER